MDLQLFRKIKQNAGNILLGIAVLIGIYVFFPVIEAVVKVGLIGVILYFAYVNREKIKSKFNKYFRKDE